MILSKITSQLNAFREKAQVDQDSLMKISQESPMERMKREIQEEIEQSEKYRASILQNVTTFAGLSTEAIHTAARSMEEVFYQKGDTIINQDDIGDSFFVLEEGLVSVTRKANSKDPNETPKELVKLGKNAHFGEISLLTAEPRSATVTVISNEAKCLRMTKQKFDELLATTNELQAESRKQIGRDVLDTVPLFKSLTTINKKKLLDVMLPMSYHSQSYICRQGTTGNVFFILTEGTCKVTVNTQDGNERELAKLHPGDFFGEVALIEPSNRRTANVISLEPVNCLTLSRNDFNRLLKSLKVKILEHQATRGASTQQSEQNPEIKQLNSLSRKRRISGYNTHGQRDELRIANILRRFARFATEALWNSLYSRMFREMLLDPNKIIEYGKFATFVMKSNESRWDTVKAIGDQVQKILETDPSRRTPADHSFIFGVMKQRNGFKDRLCKNWPIHQYMLLCKKVKMIRLKPFRKIIEVDTRGTTVFMILRGAVRIFSRMPGSTSKVIYEEDLFPGEIFGEAVLSGMHTRLLTALSMTSVDLAVIDDQDYMTAQDRDSVHMGTEEKSKFLASVPMFRNWDSYKLLRLAHALVQDEVDKGTIITKHHSPCKDIYFVVNGRVDVIDHLQKRNIITALLKYDYFGESGFLNKYLHKIPSSSPSATQHSTSSTGNNANNQAATASASSSSLHHHPPSAAVEMMNNILKTTHNKVVEEFYAVATTKIEVLILHEANFHLFDMHSIEAFRDAFFSKIQWRRERVQRMKFERAAVRKKFAKMRSEADQLPTWLDEKEASADGVQTYDDGSKGSQVHALEELHFVAYGNQTSPTGPASASSPKAMSVAGTPVANRPPSPNFLLSASKEDIEPPVISRADKAYQAALVHPLDDRMNNDAFWLPNKEHEDDQEEGKLLITPKKESETEGSGSPSKRASSSSYDFTGGANYITPHDKLQVDVNEKLKNKNYVHLNTERQYLLNNLQDIPVLLAQDYDLLMVSSSCHSRIFDKAHEFLRVGKRPLSGKSVPYRPISPGPSTDISPEGSRSNSPRRDSSFSPPPSKSPNDREGIALSQNNNNNNYRSNMFNDSYSPPTAKSRDREGIAFLKKNNHRSNTLDDSHANTFDEQDNPIIIQSAVSFDFAEEKEGAALSLHSSPKSGSRRKSSAVGGVRKSSSGVIRLPFSVPTDANDPNNTNRRGSTLPQVGKDGVKNEYRFKFLADEELIENHPPRTLREEEEEALLPLRRVSTANIGLLTRPASSPQLSIPSFDSGDANLMIIKPFSSKTPTAAMMAGARHHRSATKRQGSAVPRSPTVLSHHQHGEKTIEQLLSRPQSRRKNSVIAIELDIDGHETLPNSAVKGVPSSRPHSGTVKEANNVSSFTTGATTPYTQYQNQHPNQRRPASSGGNQLPLLAFNPYAMSGSKALFASRHGSSTNLNNGNNSSAAANIAVRGQYLMVQASNANNSNNYLATSISQNDENNNNGGGGEGNNDFNNERRTNQPPRLLTTPAVTGNKLLNQRKK